MDAAMDDKSGGDAVRHGMHGAGKGAAAARFELPGRFPARNGAEAAAVYPAPVGAAAGKLVCGAAFENAEVGFGQSADDGRGQVGEEQPGGLTGAQHRADEQPAGIQAVPTQRQDLPYARLAQRLVSAPDVPPFQGCRPSHRGAAGSAGSQRKPPQP